jgi:hypothetical protein
LEVENMHENVKRGALPHPYVKHLRAVVIAVALAVLPTAFAVGASAAAPTTTVTKVLNRHTLSDDVCVRLTKHTGCYTVSGLTQTVTNHSALIDALVRPASAWNSCTGVLTYWQTYYSWTGWALANSAMRFAFCWDNSNVQVTWGPFCSVNTVIGYGGGINYCAGTNYPTGPPGWAADSWYLYPYATPWWHVNNYQQVNLYQGWTTYFACTYC